MASNANLPTRPISGRALAKLLGLKSETAVRTAKASGRLSRCVVDGGYDAAIAIEEWRANTDPRQQRRTTAATDAAGAADAMRVRRRSSKPEERSPGGVKASEPIQAPISPSNDAQARLAAHVAANRARAAPTSPDDIADPDGRTIADIRRSLLLMEERDVEHDWQVKHGSYVPREQVLMFAQSLGREFRDSTLQLADQYAAQISADLGVDEHACHTVLDRYMRKHFEAVIKTISTDKVLSGEEPEVEEPEDLADAADPDEHDRDEDDA